MTQPNDILDLNQIADAIAEYDREIEIRRTALDKLTHTELRDMAEAETLLRQAEQNGYRLLPDQAALLDAYKGLRAAKVLSEGVHTELRDFREKLHNLNAETMQKLGIQNAEGQKEYNLALKWFEKQFVDLQGISQSVGKASAAEKDNPNLEDIKKRLKDMKESELVNNFPIVKNMLIMYGDMCLAEVEQLGTFRYLHEWFTTSLTQRQTPLEHVHSRVKTIEESNEAITLENLNKDIESAYSQLNINRLPENLHHVGGALRYVRGIVRLNPIRKAEFENLESQLQKLYQIFNEVHVILRKLEDRRAEIRSAETQKALQDQIDPLSKRVDNVETELKALYTTAMQNGQPVGYIPTLQKGQRNLTIGLTIVGLLVAGALIAGLFGIGRPESVESLSTEEVGQMIQQELEQRDTFATEIATMLVDAQATEEAQIISEVLANLLSQTLTAPTLTPLTQNDVEEIVVDVLTRIVTPTVTSTITSSPTYTLTVPPTNTPPPMLTETSVPSNGGIDINATTKQTTPEITLEPESGVADQPFTLTITQNGINYRSYPDANDDLTRVGSFNVGQTIKVVGRVYGTVRIDSAAIFLQIQLDDPNDLVSYYVAQDVLNNLSPQQQAELERRFPLE